MESSGADALVVGESLIDIVPAADGGTAELPGGSPLNAAIGLGRLGRNVELATWIGQDPRGAAIQRHLAASHVNLSQGSDQAKRTSSARVTLDGDGKARYQFDINWEFAPPPSIPPLLVHTGSLATAIQPGAEAVSAFIKELRNLPGGGPTVSFDPNLRAQFAGDLDQTVAQVEALVAASDVVKASDEDLGTLYGDVEMDEAARWWLQQGPSLVVVTCGAGGAMAFARHAELGRRAERTKVQDTVGAGDAFTAGLLDGLWTEGLLGAAARPKLAAIDEPALWRVL
ncbi:MAG: carbohydrate kinase, partial [Bifidobacteriaceae bacterium]|nr:carbohydrate kinase [Bifidobacteriaceae bacterium]